MLYFDMKTNHRTLDEAEDNLILMEGPDCENIFVGLTNHQKRLIQAIAKAPPHQYIRECFSVGQRLGSQGGVQSSLVRLKKLDLVEQRDSR